VPKVVVCGFGSVVVAFACNVVFHGLVCGLWLTESGLSHLAQCRCVCDAEQKSDKRGFKGVEVERTECECVKGGEGEHCEGEGIGFHGFVLVRVLPADDAIDQIWVMSVFECFCIIACKAVI